MNGFDEILGQHSALQLLRRLHESQRIPQALLFAGREGLGKATVAHIFATALLCESEESTNCGTCNSCRVVARGSHPDLLEVSFLSKKADSGFRAEPDEKGELRTQIVISQIRQLTQVSTRTPRLSRRRVILIDPADRMNTEAQNALLKTLEEPPGPTYLILISSRPHMLLPTVRSRCFRVGFSGLGASQLATMLEQRGLPAAEAGIRAALAEGCPGLALALDLDSLQERREEMLRVLEAVALGPRSLAGLAAMVAAIGVQDPASLELGIDLMQALLRDATRSAIGLDVSTLIHVDLAPRLSRLGSAIGTQRAAELVRLLDVLRGYLRFNTNRTLIAEAFLAAAAGGPMPLPERV